MQYLIDGYNLLRALRKLRMDEPPGIMANERSWLFQHLHQLMKESNRQSESILLVFDGFPVKDRKSQPAQTPGMEVVFSQKIDADTWIENHLASVQFPKEWKVISDDNRIRKAAKNKGAQPISCLDFEFFLVEGPPEKKEAAIPMKPENLTPEEVTDWEKTFFPNPRELEEFDGLSDPFFRRRKKKN